MCSYFLDLSASDYFNQRYVQVAFPKFMFSLNLTKKCIRKVCFQSLRKYSHCVQVSIPQRKRPLRPTSSTEKTEEKEKGRRARARARMRLLTYRRKCAHGTKMLALQTAQNSRLLCHNNEQCYQKCLLCKKSCFGYIGCSLHSLNNIFLIKIDRKIQNKARIL